MKKKGLGQPVIADSTYAKLSLNGITIFIEPKAPTGEYRFVWTGRRAILEQLV